MAGDRVKTSTQVDFKFPVIGFTPDAEIWGFPDRKSLTTCGARTISESLPVGMQLIDGSGQQFRVLALRKEGRAEALIPWLISSLLSGKSYRIEYDLEPQGTITLDEIRARACASLEAFPQDYCAEDKRETVLLPLIASVRAASDAREIFELLGLDSFEAY